MKTKTKPEPFVAVSIRLPRSELDHLGTLARETGLTRSALLRIAFLRGKDLLSTQLKAIS